MARRILFVTTWFPSQDKLNQGAFVAEHARCVKESGNEVLILYFRVDRSSKLACAEFASRTYLGVSVVEVTIKTLFPRVIYNLPGLQFILACGALNKIIQNYSPQIVHSHVTFPASFIGDRLSSKWNLPHVITEHWSELPKFLKRHPLGWLKGKRVLARASFILPVSNHLARMLQQTTDGLRVRVIPNSIDPVFIK